MKIRKQKVKAKIQLNQLQVIFQIAQPYAQLMKCVSIDQYKKYQEHHLKDIYQMKISNNSNIIKFSNKYVLQDNNHSVLKAILQQLVDQFIAYHFVFPDYLSNQMKCFEMQMNKDDNVIVGEVLKINDGSELMLVCTHNVIDRIDDKMRRLQQFKKEVLIYNTDYYMNCCIKMDIKQYKHFLKGLIQYYSKQLKNWIYKQLQKVALQDNIYLKDIQPFIRSEMYDLNSSRDYKNYNSKTGIQFTVYGFEQTFAKLFKFVERWMQKLNFMRIVVKQIMCCKRQDINQYFKRHYKKGICILLPKQKDQQSLIIFQPPKSKQQLKKQIQTTNRIITGLDFHKHNAQWSVIFYERKEFLEYLHNQNCHIQNLKIYKQYLIMSGDKQQEERLRGLISEFLNDHQLETAEVPYFVTPFQISIFDKIYRNKFDLKVQFFLKDKKLFRKNWKQNSEIIDQKIQQILNQMKHQLVFKPLAKNNYPKRDYFKQLPAIQWQNLECLESMRFRVQKKIEIFLRSYGSMTNNEERCIFIVDKWQKCKQLEQILCEQGMNLDIQNKIFKNKKLGLQLRKNKYFDSIITWVVNSHNLKRSRDNKYIKALKQQIEQFVTQNRNKRQLKLFFPQGSEVIIEQLIPILIDSIVSSCKILIETKLKQVYLFTSMNGGSSLRNTILINLSKILKDGTKIQRISTLDLRMHDIDKIVSYGYVNLCYYQNNQTKKTTNLNAFIFKSQLKKKNAQIPIFLPQESHHQLYDEYLVNCQTQDIFVVRGYSITKSKKKLIDIVQLNQIISTIKVYFRNIDYVVAYGDKEGQFFCKRMFFTSTAEKHYKNLVQVELILANMKINIGTSKMKYQLTLNEFFELKKIETHQSKVPQLIQLMSGTMIG